MTKSKRVVLALIALGVLLFGLLCLNYTKVDGLEHHQEWAAESGLPPPGPNIFRLGVAATALGAGLFGFVLGRRQR